MAKKRLNPSNGSVSIGTSLVADFASIDLVGDAAVEDATPYGANKYAINVSNGTPSLTLSVGAFAIQGVANSGLFGANAANFSADGATSTVGFDTGCTESFLGVMKNIRAQQARMRGATPLTFTLMNAGENTETWATS